MTDADMPYHLMIGVTEAGHGPVEHHEPEFHHYTCWCRNEDAEVIVKFDGGYGVVLCPYTHTAIHVGFPPGWFEMKERDVSEKKFVPPQDAHLEAKTKFIKAAAGAMSVVMLTVLACLPAIVIIAWKAAL